MRKSAYVLFIFLFGCNSSQSSSTVEQDSILTKTALHPIHSEGKSSVDKAQILGTWTDGSTENATFDIQEDSIFYVEEMQSYPYSLSRDTMSIRYPDMSFKGKVYFITDTMVLTDAESGTTKYIRFKN
jgi:hypothetical protein